MSILTSKLQTIESLYQAIKAYGKLSDDVLRKIEYKLRLECNYHSNKIEGGTLTKLETRSIMTGNITVEGKPLKDIREMTGHDEVMKDIFAIGIGDKRVSEKRIRDMHRKVIVAQTSEQEIGNWKTVGNHVFNYRDEQFHFTPPEAVPAAIHDLLNWLNAEIDKIERDVKNAPNPLLLAFEFHLRYLTIHPFSDGNGRTARLLTNLVLVSLEYPPFWVAEGGEKERYNLYLADVQAYGGSPDLLFEFMAGLVERSLQLVLDAAAGKDIEDMDDWKKKVVLLKNSLPEEDALSVMRSEETIMHVYDQSIKPTLLQVMEEMTVFDDLFLTKKLWLGTMESSKLVSEINDLDDILLSNPVREDIRFNYHLEGYKKSIENPFYIQCRLIWKFNNDTYSFHMDSIHAEAQFKKQYNAYYTAHEINDIVRQCGEFMLQEIEKHTHQ